MLMWEKLLRREMYGEDDPASFVKGTRKGQGRIIAQGLGVSPTAVHNLLTFSSAQPRIDTLKRMADFFVVPLPFLLVESGPDDAANETIIKSLALDADMKSRLVDLIKSNPV